MAWESYLKVKLIFYRNNLILDPPEGVAAAWARHLVATKVGIKNAIFPLAF